MKKIIITLLACMVCMLAMAQSEEIVFTPQWTAQAQFAGYYVAEAKGFYRDAGLNVHIKHPSASNPCINHLKEGKSQLITLHLISAMKHINAGIPLINVLQTSQSNSQMIISHKPLKGVESLRGKRVGRWKAGYFELGVLINNQYNLQLEWVPFVQNTNLYITGAIDATMAMVYNEYYQLLMAGQHIDKNQTLYFRDLGCNVPEDGLYTTAEYYRTHEKEVKAFAEASRKGWEWAANHPEETIDIVMKVVQANNVKTNRAAQRWMLREILQVMKDEKSEQRTYRLKESSLQHANRILLKNHAIQKAITYKQITKP